MRTFFLSTHISKILLGAVVLTTCGNFTMQGQTPPPAGQEQQQPAKPAEVKQVDETKPDVPLSSAPVDPNAYEIGYGDVILIKVWREAELTGFYTVRPDGRISMPLAGDIEASGATPAQLKERVLTALSKTMVRPELLLEVRQVNSKKFMISGEVARPGSFPLVNPISVLEAISQAGGLKEFANARKITIIRGNERIRFNYKEVIKGKNMEQNIMLKPGDHVVIP